MDEEAPEYLKTREVADLFRVDMKTVAIWARDWKESGAVRVVQTPGGQFRFNAADIRRLWSE